MRLTRVVPLVIVCLAIAAPVRADLITIDFNNFVPGTFVDGVYPIPEIRSPYEPVEGFTFTGGVAAVFDADYANARLDWQAFGYGATSGSGVLLVASPQTTLANGGELFALDSLQMGSSYLRPRYDARLTGWLGGVAVSSVTMPTISNLFTPTTIDGSVLGMVDAVTIEATRNGALLTQEESFGLGFDNLTIHRVAEPTSGMFVACGLLAAAYTRMRSRSV